MLNALKIKKYLLDNNDIRPTIVKIKQLRLNYNTMRVSNEIERKDDSNSKSNEINLKRI